jgi:hypothetical protein
MEFKGTKGKWEFNNENFIEIQIKKPLKSICAINTNVEEYEANALLISKAPEMLEELKFAVRVLKDVHSVGASTPMLERWEKLIKEATEI